MNYTNIYYVTSPFQYLCALEARQALPEKHSILILEVGDTGKGLTQLEELVSNDHWDEIFRLSTGNRTITTPKLIRKLNATLKSIGRTVQYFCYGEYTSWRINLILNNVQHQVPVYFDDGTLTLVEYETYIKHQKVFHRSRWLQDALLRFQGTKPLTQKPFNPQFTLFSLFGFPDCQLHYIENSFGSLLARYGQHELYDAAGPVAFIGQGAIGHRKMKPVDVYLEEIHEAIALTPSKSITYFPHRSETSSVREAISSIEGVSYHDSNQPLEVEALANKLTFSRLIAPYSTVLFTFKKLSPDLPITFIREKEDILSKQLITREIMRSGIADTIIEAQNNPSE